MSVIQSHYSLRTSHPAFTAAGRATYSVVARQAGVWIKLRIINIHSRVYTIQSQGKSDGSLVRLHLICSSTSRRWLISCYNLLTALLFVPCSVESVCQIPGPIKSAPFKTHVVLMVGGHPMVFLWNLKHSRQISMKYPRTPYGWPTVIATNSIIMLYIHSWKSRSSKNVLCPNLILPGPISGVCVLSSCFMYRDPPTNSSR